MNRFKTELKVESAVIEVAYDTRTRGKDGWNSHRWTVRQVFPASDGPAIFAAYESRQAVTLAFDGLFKAEAVIASFRQVVIGVMAEVEVVWQGVGPLVAA